MTKHEPDTTDSRWLTARAIKWIVSAYLAAAVLYGIVVWSVFRGEKAGLFGDMYGAFNAFMSGIAMLGIIAAILLQRQQNKMQAEELRLQRDELAHTREELRGQKEALEAQNKHAAQQVEAAHNQLARWDKDYIERNKPVVFSDRWEHPELDGNFHYVIRNVGGGFAVNVYYIDADSPAATPLALGSLAANAERRVPATVGQRLANAGAGLRHILIAEGPWSRTTQWTATLNFRTPDGDIRHGAVQHKLAQVVQPPTRNESQPLRTYLENNLQSFVQQLQAFGTSMEE